jgi:hypothetical protein
MIIDNDNFLCPQTTKAKVCKFNADALISDPKGTNEDDKNGNSSKMLISHTCEFKRPTYFCHENYYTSPRTKTT